MSPHRSEDVVKLDVDSRKGQEAGDDHLNKAGAVPRNFGRDFTCHLGCSGGSIEVMVGIILGNGSSQHSQWHCHQSEDCEDGEDSREG